MQVLPETFLNEFQQQETATKEGLDRDRVNSSFSRCFPTQNYFPELLFHLWEKDMNTLFYFPCRQKKQLVWLQRGEKIQRGKAALPLASTPLKIQTTMVTFH